MDSLECPRNLSWALPQAFAQKTCSNIFIILVKCFSRQNAIGKTAVCQNCAFYDAFSIQKYSKHPFWEHKTTEKVEIFISCLFFGSAFQNVFWKPFMSNVLAVDSNRFSVSMVLSFFLNMSFISSECLNVKSVFLLDSDTRKTADKTHKHNKQKKKWTALGCLSMKETPNTSKKNGKLIDLAHISISFSQPRWWLKIIDWKMSTLRLIDFCTCSLSLSSSSCSTSFGFSLSVLLFHDTDGMKRRFVVKINKKSINLLRDCYTCLLLHDGTTSAK